MNGNRCRANATQPAKTTENGTEMEVSPETYRAHGGYVIPEQGCIEESRLYGPRGVVSTLQNLAGRSEVQNLNLSSSMMEPFAPPAYHTLEYAVEF